MVAPVRRRRDREPGPLDGVMWSSTVAPNRRARGRS